MVKPVDYHTFAWNPEDILHDACGHLLVGEDGSSDLQATGDALKIIGDALSRLMREEPRE